MLARVVRGRLTEAYHEGALAVVDPGGKLITSWGEVDRPYYSRSAAKPFQAVVAQEAGAGLDAERLAMACASHGGQPVHVALVRSMLAEAGLSEEHLRCPPSWPLGESARLRLVAEGHIAPRRLWSNCSGKHAAMLVACVSSGWSLEGYTDPDHPLQRRVAALWAEVTGQDLGPLGVDGCGVPTFPVTTLGLGRAYGRLATEERFAEVASAMHRFPALVSDGTALDARLATWLNAVAKGGAMGCLGLGVLGGPGLAAKCWDGSRPALGVGILAALGKLDLLPAPGRRHLADLATPLVYGGGRPVGRMEPALE